MKNQDFLQKIRGEFVTITSQSKLGEVIIRKGIVVSGVPESYIELEREGIESRAYMASQDEAIAGIRLVDGSVKYQNLAVFDYYKNRGSTLINREKVLGCGTYFFE